MLKQSTARNKMVLMVSSTDHTTGLAALTLTITASKDGAAFSSISPTVTDLGSGWYNLALTTTHTNTLGDLILHITATGADPTDVREEVVVDLPGTGNADITAIKAKTDNLPSDPADASVIAGEFTTVNSTLATIAGYIDTEVAAIKAKTDNLPSDPADASDIASAFGTVNSTLSTIAGYIDTEVGAIKAKTDNLPAVPASQGDVTTVGAEVTAIKAKTDLLAFTSGNVHANAQVVADKTGYSLAAGGIAVKKNVALAGFQFVMTDDTTHAPATGLTVTVRISKNGGALGASTNAAAEIGSGLYKIDFAAADLNGDTIGVEFSATGADTRFATIVTQA